MVDSLPHAPTVHGNDKEHRRLLAMRANATLPKNGSEPMTGPHTLLSVTVAELADYPAASYTGAQLYVSDETGGPTLAFSDGTNWLRTSDNAPVS